MCCVGIDVPELCALVNKAGCRGVKFGESVEQNVEQWYAMRVTYQRELIAKRFLTERNIESFVPVRQERRLVGGRYCLKPRALLHNYIFIHSTREEIDNLKQFHLPYLRYVMHTQNGERQIMVVPEEQMRSFVIVAGSDDERVMFLPSENAKLAKGERVRILAGPFAGVEGVLAKVAGVRDRRVVVKIEGVAAVTAPTLPAEFVERIE